MLIFQNEADVYEPNHECTSGIIDLIPMILTFPSPYSRFLGE